jgi:tRNA(fMet)-specific endonuclease VapC
MSGKDNIFLDTNANAVFVSVISQLEFLSFDKLNPSELSAFNSLITRVKIIYLDKNEDILKSVIEIRKKYKLKLPDAIIAAKAIANNAILITNDKGFKKVKELKSRTL